MITNRCSKSPGYFQDCHSIILKPGLKTSPINVLQLSVPYSQHFGMKSVLRLSLSLSVQHLESTELYCLDSSATLPVFLRKSCHTSLVRVCFRSFGNNSIFYRVMSPSVEPQNLKDCVSAIMSPIERIAQLYPQALNSHFIAFYDSQGGGGILTQWYSTGSM
jgi:hypothetical protein